MLRLLKVRLDFFLLPSQAGSSLDLSTFMWMTMTCSFAFLEHSEMGTLFLWKVSHGWAVQACSASSSLLFQPVFCFFLWFVLNSVKEWRLPLVVTPSLSSAEYRGQPYGRTGESSGEAAPLEGRARPAREEQQSFVWPGLYFESYHECFLCQVYRKK